MRRKQALADRRTPAGVSSGLTRVPSYVNLKVPACLLNFCLREVRKMRKLLKDATLTSTTWKIFSNFMFAFTFTVTAGRTVR